MDVIAQNKVVKARKEHKCSFCNRLIRKDERYETQTLVDDYIYVWKAHIRCSDIASKLDMYSECYDGVTSEAFYETIVDEAYYLCQKQNINPEQLKTFQDKLGFVCEYYLK